MMADSNSTTKTINLMMRMTVVVNSLLAIASFGRLLGGTAVPDED